MAEPVIERVAAPTAEIRRLVAALDATLSGEYAPEQRHGLSLEAIFQPPMRFFLARLGGEAVGCGGVALFEDFAEVKRMFVVEGARGQGVAQALLARIEAEAREAGLDVLRLETGDRQLAAMRVYDRAGFRSCPAFGAYRAMPVAATVTSVFLEKPLAAAAGRAPRPG